MEKIEKAEATEDILNLLCKCFVLFFMNNLGKEFSEFYSFTFNIGLYTKICLKLKQPGLLHCCGEIFFYHWTLPFKVELPISKIHLVF